VFVEDKNVVEATADVSIAAAEDDSLDACLTADPANAVFPRLAMQRFARCQSSGIERSLIR
jgi:hypothetical protein